GEAAEHLANFLALRHDTDVEQRLGKLREQISVDKRGTEAGASERENADENTGENIDGNTGEDGGGTINENAG
ncbi:MAG: hypothetical protein LBB83_03380, partial [Treponema sp.]|nr:hypothetical protein [Treponema sp.]